MSDRDAKSSGFGIGEISDNSGEALLDTINILKNQPAQKLVKCSCGHAVPQSQVMMASLGTSCPDCYDEMGC